MDPVGPQRSESTPMEVDDDAPSEVSVPSSLRLPDRPTGFPPLTMPFPSSSPANVLRETGDALEFHRPTRRRRDIFGSQLSILEPTTRKRKRTDDASHPDITEHEDAFRDGSTRRVRPRLRGREDGEFSPLLIMSPRQEPSVEEETVLHYLPNPTDSSHSIQRYFHIGNPPEHGPSILLSSSSSKADDLDHIERRRSDSANSLAEVALDSVVPPKRGRLSTLRDFYLPRPFEETKQSPSSGSLVHERGLDAGPLFLSARPDQMVTNEPAGSSRSSMPSLELGSTTYFDKPLCESPDSIDPADGGLAYPGLSMTGVTQTELDFPGSRCSLHDGRQ